MKKQTGEKKKIKKRIRIPLIVSRKTTTSIEGDNLDLTEGGETPSVPDDPIDTGNEYLKLD